MAEMQSVMVLPDVRIQVKLDRADALVQAPEWSAALA
jgi:hypothetical protein